MATGARRRLDVELVRRGLADSRQQARHLIDAGRVLVGGAPADKAARLVAAGEPIGVLGPPAASWAGAARSSTPPSSASPSTSTGARALDAGASTGGFTDCLLQRGAAAVVAVDVGRASSTSGSARTRGSTCGSGPTSAACGPTTSAVRSTSSWPTCRSSRCTPSPAAARPGGAGRRPGAAGEAPVRGRRAEVSRGRGVIRDPAVWRRVLDEVMVAHRRGRSEP